MRKKKIIGWREMVRLPALCNLSIGAKIDTGALTSAIHAFNIHAYTMDGVDYVTFDLHPRKRHRKPTISCEARIADIRYIKNTGGKPVPRFIIKTPIKLGKTQWDIELSLARRDAMSFRMIIGREALRGRFIVDPGRSYLMSSGRRKTAKRPLPDAPEPELFK